MVKISRYILVIIAIISFAIVLPKLYWMAFAKPISTPFIMYSCIENEFMIRRTENGNTYEDNKGNFYTLEEYEKRLPFIYVRQLLMSNTLPDSINGVEINTYDININQSSLRVNPKDLNTPDPGLHHLFESQSGRANLEMPVDFFRITWRMEFIEAETNKVLEDKSRMFSAVLYKRGFKFPAKSINGIPRTRKSYDEGYLVVDSEDQLFHIKQIQGEPFVKKVEIPEGLKFKYINCVDFKNKKYYAYLFSTDNHIYILTQDEYELIKFPIENIDLAETQIRIYGDLFNYNIFVYGDNYITTHVLDINYNKIDEYNETWLAQEERKEGKIYQFLFPAQISMTNSKSNFIKFFTEINQSFYWLIFSLVLIIIQFILVKRRSIRITNHLIDFCIIGATGIFGFLAVNIFPNKFYD